MSAVRIEDLPDPIHHEARPNLHVAPAVVDNQSKPGIYERVGNLPPIAASVGFVALELAGVFIQGYANRGSSTEGFIHTTAHVINKAIEKLPFVSEHIFIA